MKDSLTIEDLTKARDLLARSALPPLYGVALSPEALADMPRDGSIKGRFGVPVLIDSRLGRDDCETYYDWAAWGARVKEQVAWDESELATSPPPNSPRA